MTKRRMVDDTSKNSLKIAQRTEEDTLEIDRRPDQIVIPLPPFCFVSVTFSELCASSCKIRILD